MTANVSCRFLNKTPFDVTWKFYLRHPKGRFDINGKMGAIDVADLNPLSEPMGPARLEKGEMKGFTFDFIGTDYAMNGTMQLLYDNLKIAVLEKDKGATEWDKKSLTSFVANIMIKDSNLKDKHADRRMITVTNDRNTNRSLFNLAWKTIFKGVKQTIGAPAKGS